MKSIEACIITLNSIITKNNLPNVFEKIKDRAMEGRGDVVYPYHEAIASILKTLGYYCYKTSEDNMIITWNAAIENYWLEVFNNDK